MINGFPVWAVLALILLMGFATWVAFPWRQWFDWLNPFNLKTGIVDGRLIRVKEESELRKAQSDADAARSQKEWAEANGRIDQAMAELRATEAMPKIDGRRPGAHLRTYRDTIEGAITGGAAEPDAEFIKRYGAPKTMTMETLEKLIEQRKAKDPEYEDGF